MNKHTPGPWKADHIKDCGWFVLNDDEDIAEISPGIEAEANARLIKAAPDLLAACKAAMLGIEMQKSPAQDSIVAKALRAAIAKAEGE